MNFKTYQKKARSLNLCPDNSKLLHAILGLVGEAGEVAEKFKKLYRDKQGKIDDQFLIEIDKELGDVQWYLADVCSELGLDLDVVACHNIDKLESRKKRGVLTGSGDNR